MEALRATIGLSTSEDEVSFVGGSPKSHGVSADELAMATEALDSAPANGLVILGMHAPLFNMPGNTYPYFLRETQRPSQNHQPADWMKHHGIEDTTTWFPDSHDHRDTKWVMRGSSLDGLDMGVSRGEAEPLLHRIVGDGATRRADVVLAGHTHKHNEFRLDVANGELLFYLDFYTENPASYYRTRFNLGFSDPSEDTSVTYVDVVAGADPSLHPWTAAEARKWPQVVHVPTYPTPHH